MKEELFSLGEIYPSDFLKKGEQPRSPKVELKLMMDEKGYVSLDKVADNEAMFGKYWYMSGINASMRDELKDIVDSIQHILKVGDIYERTWLDIACNDGTLLSYVDKSFYKVGVDPANDNFKDLASKHCNLHIQDYFIKNVLPTKEIKFDVVTCIAMFYDAPDPIKFLSDIHDCLKDDGLLVMQMSYSGLMIKQMEFTNICHEHIYYYSLKDIQHLLQETGFQVMDIQLNDTNCGSFRVYAMKKDADITKFGSQPYRDVCELRTSSLVSYEKFLDLSEALTWTDWFKNIESLKEEVVSFIKEEKAKGKTIMGYGASTKGNTLLQYLELNDSLITAIADRNPNKVGLFTVGSNIPIISEEEMRNKQPDYLLILPFHFIREFEDRESKYLENGGKFIVPAPKFTIITQ